MQYILPISLFFIGTALGSFISVIANRYNTGLSFWRGRSFCFSCNTELKTKDLFPLFSYLFLKGRCRYCETKIPKETFVVEILMGIISVLIAIKTGIFNLEFSIFNSSTLLLTTNYLVLIAIFGTILLISVYDLKHFIIPDSFLITFFILALLHNSLFIIHYSVINSLLLSLGSGLLLALPFLLLFLISKGTWFGFGDVKYIAVFGFFLGFVEGLSAVILAFWIGAFVALSILLLQKLKTHIHLPFFQNQLTIKSEIPFGPFLSLGIILSFYFNADIFQIRSLLSFYLS